MRLGRQRDRRVQAAGRHGEAVPVLQRIGKRRSALRAEALLMARAGEPECADVLLAGSPDQTRARREKRGGVGRAGVLATPAAMAEIEMFKWAIDFKSHSTTKACAVMGIVHGKSIAWTGPAALADDDVDQCQIGGVPVPVGDGVVIAMTADIDLAWARISHLAGDALSGGRDIGPG